MQSSAELQEMVQHFFESMAAKNAAAIMATCSAEPGVLFIGSAPSEWMENLAALEPMVQASAANSSGKIPPDLQIQAMQEGTMGWSAFRYTARLPNNSTVLLRGTAVYHQEGGTWKIVHSHISVGIPDELIPNIAQASA
jgi:ketosteroid isomerase-like protein